jgi:hypothetical protein
MQQTPKCKNAPIHTMYVSFVSVMFKEEERKNKKDDAANLKIAPFRMLLASHPSMQFHPNSHLQRLSLCACLFVIALSTIAPYLSTSLAPSDDDTTASLPLTTA